MQIDVFQDTVCPWCRIGKQHLKLALQEWDGEPVTVRYHPYLLDDTVPVEGVPFWPHITAKLAGRMPIDQIGARPTEAGAQVGLTFDYSKIQMAVNTRLSHRMILLTPEAQQEAVIDAIYQAYFEDGRDIGSLDVLIEIAVECGLDAEAMREALLSDAAAEELEMALQQARDLGVRGVPFFVINNQLAFSGAHPPSMMLNVLKQAAATVR
jgi:predicted DsbA family dithiol-disulfide isomerase